MRRHITLIGGSGWRNVGDDLIAASIVDWLSPLVSAFDVAGGPNETDVFAEGGNVRRLALTGTMRARARLIWSILRARCVLIGGGGLLDDRLPGFYRPFVRAAAVARVFRVPYAFVGIGVGPIRSASTAAAYVRAVHGAEWVGVRDHESAMRLRQAGANMSRLHIHDDPVVWTRSARNPSRYRLAVNLRNWMPRAGDLALVRTEEVLQPVADAINNIVSDGETVALFSMSGLEDDDDSTILRMLSGMLRCQVAEVYSASATEVSAVVGASEVVVSMRLHGCLLAVASGVPAVGLAYDPKLEQQGRHLGFESIAIDHQFTSEGLQGLVTRATRAHRVIREPMLPSWDPIVGPCTRRCGRISRPPQNG